MEIGQNGTARSWALELSVGARSRRTAGIRLWGKNGKKKEKKRRAVWLRCQTSPFFQLKSM